MLTTDYSLLTTGYGELAQLARAPALHAGGHRFDSDILHVQLIDATRGLPKGSIKGLFRLETFIDILGKEIREKQLRDVCLRANIHNSELIIKSKKVQ